MEHEDDFPRMYVLTEMTGRKASAGRTATVQGFEINHRMWIVSLCALGPALPLGLLGFAFFGLAGWLITPVVVAAILFLVEGRSSTGMKLRKYETIRDKHKHRVSRFYIHGVPLVLGEASMKPIIHSSIPVEAATDEVKAPIEAHELFQTTKKKPRKKTSAPTAKKSRNK